MQLNAKSTAGPAATGSAAPRAAVGDEPSLVGEVTVAKPVEAGTR